MEIFGANNVSAGISIAITTAATTVTLTLGAGASFPSPTAPDFFRLLVVNGSTFEIMFVTARVTDVLTVTRNEEGTTAQAFATAGTSVFEGPTMGMLAGLFQNAYFNDLTTQATSPALPASGFTRVQVKSVNGRGMLQFSDPLVASFSDFQASLFNNSFALICPSSGTVFTTIGTGQTHTGTMTTVSAVGEGWVVSLVSAATANSVANCYSSSIFNTSLTGGVFSVTRAAFETGLGVGSTGQRFGMGLTSAASTVLNTDNPPTTADTAMFQMSTNLSETTWHFVTSNSGTGTNTRIDTTMAFTAGDLMDFYVFVPPGGTTAYWRVDNLTASTTQQGSTTLTLPATTANLAISTGVINLGTTANTMFFKKIYGETNL